MNNKIKIGIDVGGTNIEFVALNETITNKEEAIYHHYDYPKGANCNQLCTVIYNGINELLIKTSLHFSNVDSIGVAMPGALDIKQGLIIDAYNLGLKNTPIVNELKKLISYTNIYLMNDADAAAFGEYKLGALRNVSSGCLITLGTGVGAGLIINGQLYQGGKLRGTEFGHMTLQLGGKKCTCPSRGCVETLCSGTYIINEGIIRYRSYDEQYSSNSKIRTAKEIFELAKNEDTIAQSIFNDYVENLSHALASYMALLDPEIIALGGGVSLSGNQLIEPLIKRIDEIAFFHPICQIVQAQLWNKAGAIGAALYR